MINVYERGKYAVVIYMVCLLCVCHVLRINLLYIYISLGCAKGVKYVNYFEVLLAVLLFFMHFEIKQ